MFEVPASEKSKVTAHWLREAISNYEIGDEVFHRAFLANVIFLIADKSEALVSEDAQEQLRAMGNEKIIFWASGDSLPGPYAIVNQELRDVWRLVDDSSGTSMIMVKPQWR